MTITADLADGRTLEFPDGTDPAVVQATVKKMLGGQPGTPAPATKMEKPRGGATHVKDKPKPDSPLDSPPGEFVTDIPRAMVQGPLAKILSGYAGAAGGAVDLLTGKDVATGATRGADWQRATEEALSFSPKSQTSRTLLSAMGLPAEYLVEKPMHFVGSKIAEKGAPATGAMIEGAGNALSFALGFRTPKLAPSATTTLARERGLSLTPSEGGGGIVSKTVEGLAGEEKISKAVSRKNVSKAAEAIADDLGIPEGTPLTRESIAAARREAHAPFEEARGLGEITVGPKYGQALDAIEAQYKNAAKSFPNARPGIAQDITGLVDSLRVEKFDANAAVDMVKTLREAANDAYAAGKGGLGKANKAAAKAIEDAIMEDVQSNPALYQKRDLVKRLQEARERIAKTYDADKALGAEGEINPQAYRRLEEKGKKLSGAAADVAKLAKEAPRSFRKDTGGNVSFPTWADAILSAVTGGGQLAAHGATMGATLPATMALLARPATRAVMASEPYQAFQASTLPGAISYATPFASVMAEIARKQADEQRSKQ